MSAERVPHPAPTKDDLDRTAGEIDAIRRELADPAERAAFDRDVTERFRVVRERIEAESSR